MTTDSEIRKLCEEVEEYCSKATPGPWTPERVYDDEPERNGYEWEVLHHKTNPPCCSESIQDGCGMLREAEARFIARARTDLPKLLSLLRARMEEERNLRETVMFFYSVIKSGEDWSEQCYEAYRKCFPLPSVPEVQE